MADQSQILHLAIALIDLLGKLVWIGAGNQVIGENHFFFIEIELLRQDFRRLGCSKVGAGQDQIYLHFQLL